ncbi:MAG: type II toxin-antitoxin system HipA family toxin, partial [Verrucomicrobiota bacterium]
MPSPTESLEVWMNGLHVATWSVSAGVHRLQYDPAWVSNPDGRALSLSLPFIPGNLSHRGEVVENYFDNLLPDSVDIRKRLQTKFSRRTVETFDLLSAIGRDCVGAVQLLPPEMTPEAPRSIQAEPLDAAGVERMLAATVSSSRAFGEATDDFRISIAGAQEKTALLWHQERWHRPTGSTPTTHILKLPLGLVGNLQADMKDSIENEWLCAELLRGFGLPVARCHPAEFGERRVLVVERFDRAWQDGPWIARLPQEDFCQALGVPGSRKYEKEGGPGMKDILRILTASTESSDAANFVKTQLLFWALAATDGHAKNFSLFLHPGGSYRRTPLYDVISAWPIIGKGPRLLAYQRAELAMAVRGKNSHYELDSIRRRHWDPVANLAGLKDAADIIAAVVQAAPSVITEVQGRLPKGFPVYV